MARRLADRDWKLKYTPEDGDLVRLFYVPALEDAWRYDRLTGYFNAGALALAARGIEGLIQNKGQMRLIVGCTLESPEIEAIRARRKTARPRPATLDQPTPKAARPGRLSSTGTLSLDDCPRLSRS